MTDLELEAVLGHFGNVRGATLEESAEVVAEFLRDDAGSLPKAQCVPSRPASYGTRRSCSRPSRALTGERGVTIAPRDSARRGARTPTR